MDQIIFHSTQTWLWLILFGAVAMFFSGLLYLKERDLSGPKWLKHLLWGIRFVIFFLIFTLFLNPFIVENKIELEKSGFVILTDNSQSMVQHEDSVQVYGLSDSLSFLEANLSQQFNVYQHTFSSELMDSNELNYKGASTNLYEALYGLKQHYFQEPIAGVLVISDGINNAGYDPVFLANDFNFPLYTIGVGDSIQHPDLRIEDVRYNEISFLGNEFPVSFLVNADGLKGEEVQINFKSAEGNIIYSKAISLTTNFFSQRISFNTTSDQVGLQFFTLDLNTQVKERNNSNNSEVFGIEVIDSRKKMLILSEVSHPDVGVIREVLEDNSDLEVVLRNVKDPLSSKLLEQMDLVWIYQPVSSLFTKWKDEIEKLEIPFIIQLGLNTNLELIDKEFEILNLKTRKNVIEDFNYAFNSSFDYFKLNTEDIQFFNSCPPLKFPLANIQFANESKVLAYQQVDEMKTENPLICFSKKGDVKNAWIFGEGFWKWKMYDYRQNETFEHFSSLLDKMVQYVSVKKDKRRLRVKMPKKIIGHAPVMMSASYYNESFELDNSPDISLTLIDQDGKTYYFQFNKDEEMYSMQFSGLAPGRYEYSVDLIDNDEFSQNGTLLIIKNDIELMVTKSNFSKLNELSDLSDGRFYFLEDWSEMESDLMNLKSPKIKHTQQEKTPLRELSGILYLLIGLLSIEWFLRKYNGIL